MGTPVGYDLDYTDKTIDFIIFKGCKFFAKVLFLAQVYSIKKEKGYK